jgi:hypothetical protein
MLFDVPEWKTDRINKSVEKAWVVTTDRVGTRPINIPKIVVVKIRLKLMFMYYPFLNSIDFKVKK